MNLQKKYLIYVRQKMGLHLLLTVTILKVECYSFTEQNNFRSHELSVIIDSIQYVRLGHYVLDIQYLSVSNERQM